MISQAVINAINNQLQGNQNVDLGGLIRQSLNGRSVRNQDYIRYVDPNVASSGDGKSVEGAFKTISEGITELNKAALSGKGATLYVNPGDYIEVAANVPTLSSSDCLIEAVGTPEDTLFYGSGTAGVKDASTDHLLHITGNNNIIKGLALYTNKNTKASIYLDNCSGNVIVGNYFSPQTQDGVKYCIEIVGAAKNFIINNEFFGALTAAIHIGDGTVHPDNNKILFNNFIGTGIGVNIVIDNDNTLIKKNWFSAGSGASENMTNAIVLSSAMTAGSVTVSKNEFEQSAVNDISDSKTGGNLYEMDNSNGS
jgi:hypothetical protein